MIDIPISDAVRRFLLSRQSEYLAHDTILFYRTQLKAFTDWCAARGWSTGRLTQERIVGYFAHRRQKRKPTTLEAEFRAVHAFVTWCIRRKHAPEGALDGVKWPKTPRVVVEPFTRRDVKRLLEQASMTTTPARDRAIILLMADCGLRAGELCGLMDSDVREGYIHVRGKGGRDRRVPVSPGTIAAIDRWRAERGPSTHIFVTRLGKPFTRQALYDLFARLGSRCRMDHVRCSPHTLRHTTAQEWLDAGGDLATLQLLLGHARLETTMRYLVVGYHHLAKRHQEISLGRQLVG